MIDNYLDIKSINPLYWGKSGWIFLNSIALTYKPEYKENYKLFITQLPFILPCISCGEKLKANMNTLDDALISKETLLIWLLNIRNSISKENNRDEKTMNDNFNEIFSTVTTSNNNYSTTLILLVILILLIILFRYIRTKN